MNDNPELISVIIPTWNRANFLPQAINSIRVQTYEPIEIIVIDDGSTDNTADVIRSLAADIQYIYQPNAGPAAARNHGLRVCRGSLIGFLDSDDLWATQKLALQLPYLQQNPSVDIVLGHTHRMIRSTSGRFDVYATPVRLPSLGSGLFRRAVFQKVGLFDERMYYSEDVDWFMRVEEFGITLHFLDEVTQYYRFHDTNMTWNKPAREPYLLRLLKNKKDRSQGASQRADAVANCGRPIGKG